MSDCSEPYVLTRMDKLDRVIAAAKGKGELFYIGAVGKSGTRAIDAVRNCDQGPSEVKHSVFKTYKLSRVNHTQLLQNRSVCKLYGDLIAKHGDHPLCQNEKQDQHECTNAQQGIVYVRIYHYSVPRMSVKTSEYRRAPRRTKKRKRFT